MAFIPDTPAVLEQAQLASYATRFVGKDTSTESFLGKLSRAEAQALWTFQKKLQRISLDTVPNADMSYDRLADYATALGLDDGAGGYGPLVATAATGLIARATGTPGNTFTTTDTIVAADGVTFFSPIALYTIGGLGWVDFTFNAITTGTGGNLTVPAAVTFISPPPGIQSSATLSAGAINGTDIESGPDLLVRILNRLQLPPKSGTQNDYNVWCDEALPAIDRAYGYAKRHGIGAVDEVLTYPVNTVGTGTSRQLSAGDLATVSTYLDTVRPVTVKSHTVLTPYMPVANALTVRTRIVPYTAYIFDWVSLAGLHVHAYSPGTGIPDPLTGIATDQVTLSTNAPADLMQTIDLGKRPRIQIVSTGASASICPLMAEVLKYSADVLVSDKLDIVIPTTGWIDPNVNDLIFSGGDACLYVPQDQLDYINSLGPSRASGLADPRDEWFDIVATAQLSRIAMNAVNANDEVLVKNIYKVAGVEQVLIAVGVAAATTNDYIPGDDYTHAPECANAAYVLVTD